VYDNVSYPLYRTMNCPFVDPGFRYEEPKCCFLPRILIHGLSRFVEFHTLYSSLIEFTLISSLFQVCLLSRCEDAIDDDISFS
jgi:hypothetical protein